MNSFDAVRDFLDEVAAPRPTVTGGGVSAVTAAGAAGLVAMTARLSAPQDGTDTAEKAEDLRRRAMELAASDSDSYAAVLSAQRRPHEDTGRAEALRTALVNAAQPPRQTALLAAEIAGLAARFADSGNRSLRGDAITAAALAAGAAHSSAALTRINLTAAGAPSTEAEEAEQAAASAQHHSDTALGTTTPTGGETTHR